MSTSPMGALSEDDELLFRQVHPSFVRDGRVGSQAFRPTPKDEKQLSVAQGSKTTEQAAFELHTQCNRLASAGTWAVATEECRALGLPVRDDPVTEGPCPDPAHAVVDFSALSNSKSKPMGLGWRGMRTREAGSTHRKRSPDPAVVRRVLARTG